MRRSKYLNDFRRWKVTGTHSPVSVIEIEGSITVHVFGSQAPQRQTPISPLHAPVFPLSLSVILGDSTHNVAKPSDRNRQEIATNYKKKKRYFPLNSFSEY